MDEEGITLEEAVDKIAELFDDGFQAKDIWDAIPMSMQLVGSFSGLTNPEKRERVIKIVDLLLDKIDLPGWDWLTKKAIMWGVGYSIDSFYKTGQGKYTF